MSVISSIAGRVSGKRVLNIPTSGHLWRLCVEKRHIRQHEVLKMLKRLADHSLCVVSADGTAIVYFWYEGRVQKERYGSVNFPHHNPNLLTLPKFGDIAYAALTDLRQEKVMA